VEPTDNSPAEGAGSSKPLDDSISKAASELNNLLQIISGTSSLIGAGEEDKEGSEKYLGMLRASIERAEKVTAELVQYAGGPEEKMVLHSELAPFVKSKKTLDSAATKQSILLVDDEQMALTLIKRILTEAGYSVVTAQSGFECLDQFRTRPQSFDLILLDLSMPFMDGEETFGRLREIRPHVPVLLCAGFVHQERLNRLMSAGLNGFVRKPIAPDEIVGLVRSTLASVKYSAGSLNPGGVSAVI
jgi:CheY-like chemotaxis protein